MARYRFLLSFRWILLTSLVTLAVVAMVRLGFWQVDRLHEKQAANALLTARQSEPVTDAAALVPVAASAEAVDSVLKRPVSVTGTYQVSDQVLIRNRSNNSAPGFWVITPIVTPDGTAIAVNRGWIPITVGDGASPDRYAPPAGTVTVTGFVERSEHAQGLEVADPAEGRLATLSFVDLDRLQKQVPYRLHPAWVQLRDQQPPQPEGLPVAVKLAPLDEGPHLNYAGQWFIFAVLTCIVFPMSMRRAARSREAKARAALEAEAAGDPSPPSVKGTGEPVRDDMTGDTSASDALTTR